MCGKKNKVLTRVIIGLMLTIILLTLTLKPKRNLNISNLYTKQNNQFAFYIQKEDKSGYDKSKSNTFPGGYRLNIDKSSCMNNAGSPVSPSEVLESDGNKVTVTSNQTIYCTLYFDLKEKVYLVRSNANGECGYLGEGEERQGCWGFNEYIYDDDSELYPMPEQIRNIYFVNYIDPQDALLTVDLTDTEYSQEGSIIGWLKESGTCDHYNENGFYDCGNANDMEMYDFYIGSESSIYAQDLDFAFGQLCNVESINFDNFQTSESHYMSYMFSSYCGAYELEGGYEGGFKYLKNTKDFIDKIENFNTSNVENMDGMFLGVALPIEELDLSNWNTQNVVDMSEMFSYMLNIQKINLNNWNTENVNDMSDMFYRDMNLTDLNLNNWNTKNVSDMSGMFNANFKLKTINGIEKWDTSNVNNMNDLFASSGLENLNLQNWTFDNVISSYGMYIFSKANFIIYYNHRFNDRPNIDETIETTESDFGKWKYIDIRNGDFTKFSKDEIQSMFIDADLSGTTLIVKDADNKKLFEDLGFLEVKIA